MNSMLCRNTVIERFKQSVFPRNCLSEKCSATRDSGTSYGSTADATPSQLMGRDWSKIQHACAVLQAGGICFVASTEVKREQVG